MEMGSLCAVVFVALLHSMTTGCDKRQSDTSSTQSRMGGEQCRHTRLRLLFRIDGPSSRTSALYNLVSNSNNLLPHRPLCHVEHQLPEDIHEYFIQSSGSRKLPALLVNRRTGFVRLISRRHDRKSRGVSSGVSLCVHLLVGAQRRVAGVAHAATPDFRWLGLRNPSSVGGIDASVAAHGNSVSSDPGRRALHLPVDSS